MSRASVLALVEELTTNLAPDTQIADFYDDMMVDAGRWGVGTAVRLVETTRNEAVYQFPDDVVKEYAVFYDDLMLPLATLRELEATNSAWRDETAAKPRAYVEQDMPEHFVRLYPIPQQASADFSFLFGSPMGHDFPDRALGVVVGELRADLPAWLDVPLALAILSREYERESDHRDSAFAGACRNLGNMLLALVLV